MYRVEVNVIDDSVFNIGQDRADLRETHLVSTHRQLGDAKNAAIDIADRAFAAKHRPPKHVAEHIEFPLHLSAYVDWVRIGQRAESLKANIESRYTESGIVITLYWDDEPEKTA